MTKATLHRIVMAQAFLLFTCFGLLVYSYYVYKFAVEEQTKFSDGFVTEKFENISCVDTQESVLSEIGRPLLIKLLDGTSSEIIESDQLNNMSNSELTARRSDETIWFYSEQAHPTANYRNVYVSFGSDGTVLQTKDLFHID